MNRSSAEIFKRLIKKGWLDRRDDALIWNALDEEEVISDIEVLKSTFNFDTLRVGDRYYLIPTQDNDLFLKNNIDYRKDIKAGNDTRTRDLYLLNYLAIYIIFLFFRGEGSNPQCREFITKEDLISQFTEHCKETEGAEANTNDDFSESFVELAQSWLSKTEGNPDSTKVTTEKKGVINKILLKFRVDGLFEEIEGKIRPTRKMIDLIPYWLRKERVKEINTWIEEVEADAADQQD
jgi:hypothetical protein